MAFDSFYSKENNSNSVVDSMVIGRNDQRGFLRMDVKSKLTFKLQGGDTIYEGMSQDLSATGLCFVTTQKIGVGDVLEVLIKPGIDITPPLEITLTVIRAKELDNGQYEIAGELQQNATS